MPATLEYIESYFQQTLNAEDKTAFEARCETDEAFAKEVAFYITTRQALRETLLAQKTEQWKNEIVTAEETTPVISIAKRSIFSRYITYAAAACLLLFVSVYLFETNTSPKKLANNYIKSNYSNLSQAMSADSDDITQGMAAYNNKDYDKALQFFKRVEQHDTLHSDALKYIGLTYLQKEEYDSALRQFDELANMKLFSNPGDLLKAISLIERNKSGDKEEAKKLLQKVVSENEEGSEEAEMWFNKM